MGNFSAGPAAPAAAAAPVEEEEAAPAAQEKTLFALTLKSFDAGAKPKVIKEIKSMLGLSLVDSKKFVESAPKQMKEGVPKEESEKIIETMKGLGAVVTMDWGEASAKIDMYSGITLQMVGLVQIEWTSDNQNRNNNHNNRNSDFMNIGR